MGALLYPEGYRTCYLVVTQDDCVPAAIEAALHAGLGVVVLRPNLLETHKDVEEGISPRAESCSLGARQTALSEALVCPEPHAESAVVTVVVIGNGRELHAQEQARYHDGIIDFKHGHTIFLLLSDWIVIYYFSIYITVSQRLQR